MIAEAAYHSLCCIPHQRHVTSKSPIPSRCGSAAVMANNAVATWHQLMLNCVTFANPHIYTHVPQSAQYSKKLKPNSPTALQLPISNTSHHELHSSHGLQPPVRKSKYPSDRHNKTQPLESHIKRHCILPELLAVPRSMKFMQQLCP